MVCTKTGSDIGLIRLCMGINAHGQIGVSPATSLSCGDRIDALSDNQLSEEPMTPCLVRR